MSHDTTRRARTRTALTILMLAVSACLASGCARTSWSRSSAEGPRIVLQPDTETTAQSSIASVPDIN